ncbi:hypothetical protein [Metamycoplasma alkalescens]|uniref:hypothetical protein n=1 Tax=Metamycoplasma alkalescens TaxID=45363 RepID=UPI00039A246A|nr:hypothetical protein [Metamycoplasma alkalescens]
MNKQINNFKDKIELVEEQKRLIDFALDGKNVLVDACIGSGKTTTIQILCEKLPIDKKFYILHIVSY